MLDSVTDLWPRSFQCAGWSVDSVCVNWHTSFRGVTMWMSLSMLWTSISYVFLSKTEAGICCSEQPTVVLKLWNKIGTLCLKVPASTRNIRTWFAHLLLIYFREASSLFSFRLVRDLAFLIHWLPFNFIVWVCLECLCWWNLVSLWQFCR